GDGGHCGGGLLGVDGLVGGVAVEAAVDDVLGDSAAFRGLEAAEGTAQQGEHGDEGGLVEAGQPSVDQGEQGGVVDEQEAVVGDEAFDPCGGAVRRGSG